ncbi:MAG TPA: hypothetical protein VFA18_13950, partial [Gemmataceae bacterium]|nr:hypothetical protein [Gemmataceae bacterium]
MTQDWLTSGSLGRLGITFNPLGGPPIYHGAGITYSGIQAFTFDAGGLPNEVFMDGTSTATNVNANAYTVLMEVSESGNLDSIAGALTVQGNGAIPLIVNDQHNTDLYTQDTLTVSNLSRLGLGFLPGTTIPVWYPASINYSGFNGLAINLGANLATFQIVSSAIGTPVNLQGSGAGVLIGPNITNTWSLTGVNTGTVANVSFTGLPHLQGGTGLDTFKFANSSASIVGINGGGGTADQLDYSALAGPITVNLQTLAASLINGGAAGGYSNIQSFVGSSSSADTLVGPNTTTTWAISSANGGKVGTTSFTGFEDLVGGSANDTFKFSGAGSISGTVNGGGGTANKLDYSSLAGPITVNLQTAAAPLLNGGAAGGFSNLQSFTGSSSSADTLIGTNATTIWTISTANAGKAGKAGFSGFENLQGGTGLDVFKFTGTGSIAGTINGGSAPPHQGNWLDYSALGTAVTVNLQTGVATRVGGTVSNIQNVHGSNHGSTLTGNSQGNILIGGTGSDTITGGPGVSLLIGDKGADHVTGGSGGDILIGDYTTYDSMSTAHQDALMAILAEWQSADSYATRFHDINTGTGGGLNGKAKLNFGTTVLDDGVADTLTAAASTQALDWFFQGAGDSLLNKETGEHVNNT